MEKTWSLVLMNDFCKHPGYTIEPWTWSDPSAVLMKMGEHTCPLHVGGERNKQTKSENLVQGSV